MALSYEVCLIAMAYYLSNMQPQSLFPSLSFLTFSSSDSAYLDAYWIFHLVLSYAAVVLDLRLKVTISVILALNSALIA